MVVCPICALSTATFAWTTSERPAASANAQALRASMEG